MATTTTSSTPSPSPSPAAPPSQQKLPFTLTEENCPLIKCLNESLVNVLIENKHRNLIQIDEDTKLEDAIRILSEQQLLSLPVRSREGLDILGFIDVLDILGFIIKTYSESETIDETQWSTYCRDIHLLKHRGVRFGLTPVREVVDFSKTDPYVTVNGHGTLSQLIEQAFGKGVRRVPVINEVNGILQNIVSQSDMLEFIAQKCMKRSNLGILERMTLGELNLGTQNVIMMSVNALAIHAFYLMFYHKVSAVAIVDEDEQIVLNLSASDLRGLNQTNFDSLLLPVLEFVHRLKHIPHSKPLVAPITCLRSTTLSTAIFKMSMFRLHRLWIVDIHGRPVGVLSLTDLLALFDTA